MSNLDHADFISNQQDDDSHPADTYTQADEDAMYAAWLARQPQPLQPITARCNAFPAQPLAEFAGVFDKPVRPTIAERVAEHVASL